MKFEIIISKKDAAGMNIAQELDKLKISYNLLEQQTIYEDDLDKKLDSDADFFIFATKHQSVKDSKTLTVHAPGNWNKADFGGQEGIVCPTSTNFIKHIFKILNNQAQEKETDYQVTLEATHHGPKLDKPCCFIEIGSTQKQWQDPAAGEIIASTIQQAISNFKEDKDNIPAIAIGGPHYCPNFTKIQLNSQYSIGHIIANYAFPVSKEMIQQAIDKTIEKPKTVIIDWKGCGKSEERQKLIDLLENMNLKIVRTDRVGK